jgi:hypothetical protein
MVFSDIRQTDIHTAEPLVPELSAFEVEMNIGKLKRHKLPDIDQTPAFLFKAEGRKIRYEIHKFINSVGIRRYCLRIGRVRSLYLSIKRVKKQNLVILEIYQILQLCAKFYPATCSQG